MHGTKEKEHHIRIEIVIDCWTFYCFLFNRLLDKESIQTIDYDYRFHRVSTTQKTNTTSILNKIKPTYYSQLATSYEFRSRLTNDDVTSHDLGAKNT